MYEISGTLRVYEPVGGEYVDLPFLFFSSRPMSEIEIEERARQMFGIDPDDQALLINLDLPYLVEGDDLFEQADWLLDWLDDEDA